MTIEPGPTGAEPARGEVTVIEATKLERTVARGVAESKATVPHAYAEADIEMGAWADALAGVEGVTHVDVVIWAAARALRECPRVNGAYRDGRFELYSRVNVGFVAPAGEAFLVPTIADADAKPLAAIAAEARELERRAREGSITQPDLSGGTFTVSCPAADGLAGHTPVVHRGQAGTLGTGALCPTPLVRDNAVEAGHSMRAVLAYDARILNAQRAAEFLARLAAHLAAPPAEAL